MVAALGVSQGTVRKALDGLVEEGLIERSRSLGTIINRKNIGSTDLRNLVVITPNYPGSLRNVYFDAFRACATANGAVSTFISLEKGDDWNSCQQQLPQERSEVGIVLMENAPGITRALYELLRQRGYRVAVMGVPPAGLLCNNVQMCVRSDVRLGVERLVKDGHRRIMYLVGEPEGSPEVQRRVAYFKETTTEFGLAEAEVLHCGVHAWESSSEAGLHAVGTIWERPASRWPTAIFGVSAETTVGALLGISRKGLRVPDDISLITHDCAEINRIVQPNLTALYAAPSQMVDALFELLSSPQGQNEQRVIESALHEGASVAPARPPGS